MAKPGESNGLVCACGRQLTGRQRTRCTMCARADPHKHAARSRQYPRMFVSVDGEWPTRDRSPVLLTFSYGREDGSRGSIVAPDTLTSLSGIEVCRWLLAHVRGLYTAPDGTTYRQVPVSFHFTGDGSVLARDFIGPDMMLAHSATSRDDQRGQLCGTDHDHTECGKLDRFNQEIIQHVITDGEELGLIGLDRASGVGIAMTPRRRLYLEHRPHGDSFKGNQRVDIHDTGTSFIGSLEQIIEQWGPELSPEDRNLISWGKQLRGERMFSEDPRRLASYSEAECVAHARVCRLLLDAVRESAAVIIREDKLYGSGSIAAEVFAYHRVPKRKQTHTCQDVADPGPGYTVDEIAALDYFGGMIETPVLGLIEGEIDEVDIASAYPSKMVKLPCMREGHGRWEVRSGWTRKLPRSGVGHVQVSWAVTGTSTPPFIVRSSDGRVRKPAAGERVWVTLPEYWAGRDRFGEQVIAHRAVWWVPECECPPPFAFLAELYQKRADIKARMKSIDRTSAEYLRLNLHQLAIKLIINSGYGKLAQRRPMLGPYTNFHYAAMITGGTRAQVCEETWAREDQGGTVVYQHTDSVLSIGGTPRGGDGSLGTWDLEKQSRDLVVVQPGLAVSLGGGKTASRGCKAAAFEDAVRHWISSVDLTTHPRTWPDVEIPRQMMISRRLARHRGKPELAGAFVDAPLSAGFRTRKRDVDRATPVPGCPTAWQIPPVPFVYDAATLEDVEKHYRSIAERAAAGEFDEKGTQAPSFSRRE